MPTKRNVETWTILATCFLLAASLLGKLYYLHSASNVSTAVEPGVVRNGTGSALWDVDRKPVRFQFDHYLHYGLDAAPQWSALVPNDGLVYVGEEQEAYMPSMFHQLRCLDILREQYGMPLEDRDMELGRHCMNYLRQMVLCRGDMHLETFLAEPWSPENVDRRGTYRCRDFRAVYGAAERSRQEHRAWLAGGNVSV